MTKKERHIPYNGTREEWLTRMDGRHRCTLFIPNATQYEIQKLVKEGWKRCNYRDRGKEKSKPRSI